MAPSDSGGQRPVWPARVSSHVVSSARKAVERLADERAPVSARLGRMDEDMTELFAASRDANADDEHDQEVRRSPTRSQLSAMIRLTNCDGPRPKGADSRRHRAPLRETPCGGSLRFEPFRRPLIDMRRSLGRVRAS